MAGRIPPPLPRAREKRLGLAAKLGLTGLCVLSVLMSGLVLDFATDEADLRVLRQTLNEASRKTTRSIAFVGTSRFLRGINPPALEAALEASGCAANVYVFASPGLSVLEEQRAIALLQSNSNTNFDLLVLDRSTLPLNLRDSALRGNLRGVVDELRANVDLRDDDRFVDLRFVYDTFRVGALSLLSKNKLTSVLPMRLYTPQDHIQGHLPFRDWEEAEANDYVPTLDTRRGSERSGDLASASWLLPPIPSSLARSMRNRLEAANWPGRVAFLFMPVGDVDEGALPGVNAFDEDVSLINLNDHSTHAFLVNAVYWHDAEHLSNVGAEKLATPLAPHICEVLEPSSAYALR